MPCYRCTSTIRRAVLSVARQSWRPMELILVDDGSEDGTVELLHVLRQELGAEWVRVIALNGNLGAASARNVGWDAAHGEFVAFLDADDTWHRRKLELQYKLMKERPTAALSGHASARLNDADQQPEVHVEPGFTSVALRDLLIANRFTTPSAMVKRTVPHRFRATQRYMEDHLLWMEIAAGGNLVLRLNATLAFTFKPSYGSSGLSANLWQMEKAELGNYSLLAKHSHVSYLLLPFLWLYSLVKFCKRLIIVALRIRC